MGRLDKIDEYVLEGAEWVAVCAIAGPRIKENDSPADVFRAFQEASRQYRAAVDYVRGNLPQVPAETGLRVHVMVDENGRWIFMKYAEPFGKR